MTLDDCQRSLSIIVQRAADGTASELDAVWGRILVDGMKYLVPTLEASLVENRSDTRAKLIELLQDAGDDDGPPLLEA